MVNGALCHSAMASTAVSRKRGAAALAVPDWSQPLEANKFVYAVYTDPELVRTLCEGPDVFCDWLWESRRHEHLIACTLDDGGDSVGWCTLSRMVLLSACVRRHFRVASKYSIESDTDYNTLAQMGLCMCSRRIRAFDATDVRMTVRLISSRWSARSLWNREYTEAVRLVEMLLYDIGLRVEELWNGNSARPRDQALAATPVLVTLMQETARATACVHAVLAFTRYQVTPKRDLTAARAALLPAECVRDNDPATLFEDAVDRLGDDMERIFRDNMRLGTMTEEMCASMLILLSPLDTTHRARAVAGIDIADGMAARRRVVSVNEYIWDMTKMHGLSADALLDPEEWDADNAWLIHAAAMLRVASIMISQFNTQLQWTSACVLFDRDAFKVVTANGFSTNPPVLYIHAFRMFLLYGDRMYLCQTIPEAFLLWCCIIYGEHDGRLAATRDTYYDLKKELTNIFDICCPRTVAEEFSEESDAHSDAELCEEAHELLAALGIDPPARADTQEAFVGPSGDVPEAERERRAKIDALFADSPEREPSPPRRHGV